MWNFRKMHIKNVNEKKKKQNNLPHSAFSHCAEHPELSVRRVAYKTSQNSNLPGVINNMEREGERKRE